MVWRSQSLNIAAAAATRTPITRQSQLRRSGTWLGMMGPVTPCEPLSFSVGVSSFGRKLIDDAGQVQAERLKQLIALYGRILVGNSGGRGSVGLVVQHV